MKNSLNCQQQLKHCTYFSLERSYPSYEYVEEHEKRKEMPARDEAGRVKTKERNFVTNLTSKIDKEVMKFPKHIPDPYDRKK